jgi:hypothetical protein
MKFFIIILSLFFTIFQSGKPLSLCNKKEAMSKLDIVKTNAKQLLSESSAVDDNCVLSFLDTLTYCFIKTGELKYISTLNAISKVSDGYISEYLWELTEKMINQNFTAYSDYLTGEKKNLEKYLLQIMIPEDRKKILYDKIDLELSKNKLKKGKREYLKLLKVRVSKIP